MIQSQIQYISCASVKSYNLESCEEFSNWHTVNHTVTVLLWHLLDPCGCGHSIWKHVLERRFRRLLRKLDKKEEISDNVDQRKQKYIPDSRLSQRQSPTKSVEKKEKGDR